MNAEKYNYNISFKRLLGNRKIRRISETTKIQRLCFVLPANRPRGYKTFFMLNSTEHESFPAHKRSNAINIYERKNSILDLSEPESSMKKVL